MRSRFRQYLAAATLLTLPIIAACGEDIMPPPPTGSIVGQVSIEGMGADGVTVSLSNGASTATAGGGNYRFDTVEQGSYTVTISGFPADASFDQTSAPASIGDTGGTVPVDFRGTYIRTASIMGTVTVEGTGLGGVTVRLSGMGDHQTATDDMGQYSFTGLRAGTYSVEISSFDTNEVSFSSTSGAATVGVGESKVVSFDGTYLRTAGIQGQVSVDGEGLAGVTVTLMGHGEEGTAMTDAGGLYSFSKLRSGTYQVAISGYDTDDYEFATTSKSATVATGETANVPFEGTLLRTAGIAGRVSVEGTGLNGVTVTLAGAADATTETAGGGQYSFAGLAAGTYVVSIENPDDVAYNFDDAETTKNITLEDDQSAIVNFDGTHTRTASVTGKMYLDEAPQDKMYTANEPALAHAGLPLILQGPGVNDVMLGVTMDDGSFAFEGLIAGSYRVLVDVTEEVATGLAEAGYAFAGDLTGQVVSVGAGMEAQVNFPFRITTQTIMVGAVMGNADETGAAVAGVELALYADADMAGMLGEAKTDEMGMAKFDFARADNTGPGGNDNIVFVKVKTTGHDALMVSDNDFTEVTYAGTDRVSNAPAAVKLVNVAVAFDFWVKSNETARDGDMGLEGWNTVVMMGDAAMEMGPDATDEDGKSSFAYTVDPAMLPATFTVMATEGDKAGQPDMGEAWMQGEALMHTHTGLDLPSDDMADLGPIRITYTTQAIYVGVHRELDDRTGYTDYHGAGEGDGRPSDKGHADNEGAGKITITLMTADSRGRLRAFEYDHDADPKTDDQEAVATAGASGMVSFKNIPANTEITVVADEGSGMVVVPDSRASREIDAFGDQLDDYPDGVMVGTFGEGSGARPDVWICPLQRQKSDDPNEVCSTYAYKWTTGTVSGTVSNLRKGDKATLTLDPVNSNDDYADDLAKDQEVTGTGSGPVAYSFAGVADGNYTVTLEAKAGSWSKKEAKGIEVVHDESSDATDYTGATDGGNNLSVTDLRGIIKGRVANESNNRDGLTRDESRAGVVVNLHAASRPIASGANLGRRTIGAKLATAETDGDGVFMFEGLTVGGSYFLITEETDLYTAVRTGETRIPGQKEADIVKHALASAIVPPSPAQDPGTPTWNHRANTGTPNGANNFTLLYKDGEVEGEVSDPSARAAHSRAVAVLQLCRTATPATGDITGCNVTGTPVELEADVDADGNWIADGVREGVYRVIVDRPAGYIAVSSTGTTETSDAGYYTQQFVELKGGRAEAETETFHIKDENADGNSSLTRVTVDNNPCNTASLDAGDPTSNACGNDVAGSFSVTVDASPGAVVRLSNLGSDDDVNTGGNRSFEVRNGHSSTITLDDAGSESFFVHVRSADGYGTNGSAGLNNPSTAGFHLRKNADARLDKLTLTFDGGTIVLDRRELGLDPGNPDGETGPVTGAHPVAYTVDGADGTSNPVPSAVALTATGKDGGFDLAVFETLDSSTAQCTLTGASTANSPHSITLPANSGTTKGTVGFCVAIIDSDGGTPADANTDNRNVYRVVLTRQ